MLKLDYIIVKVVCYGIIYIYIILLKEILNLFMQLISLKIVNFCSSMTAKYLFVRETVLQEREKYNVAINCKTFTEHSYAQPQFSV